MKNSLKNLTLTVAFLTSIVFFSGCGESSRFRGFTKAKETGLHYKFYYRNESDTALQPKVGDGVEFRYIIYKYPNDSVIVDSKKNSQSPDGYARFILPKTSFKGSFEDGLMMMKEGDSAAFIISADSFFLKTMQMKELPVGFRPGLFVRGVFKLRNVLTRKEIDDNLALQKKEMEEKMKVMQENEEKDLKEYLQKNKINQKPEESGLIIIVSKKGSGSFPASGDSVYVNYSGYFLNGNLFDTNIETIAKKFGLYQEGRPYRPFAFLLGSGNVIPGWEEGISKLNKGARARLIIPSSLAYGPSGSPPVIPPFSTLIFDVEIINIVSPPKP